MSFVIGGRVFDVDATFEPYPTITIITPEPENEMFVVLVLPCVLHSSPLPVANDFVIGRIVVAGSIPEVGTVGFLIEMFILPVLLDH